MPLSTMPLSHATLLDFVAALRPRLALQDAIMVVAIICAATLFAFEYDFFSLAPTMTIEERRITAQEYFALTGLLIVILIGFSYYRLRQQKREYQLRVAAEFAARSALHQAMHDSLTGLANRRALLVAIEAALENRATEQRSHALLLLDLDGFKAVNDTHGHAAGDQILQVVAQRLRREVDATMLPARLGGDEFAIWCADIPTRGSVRDFVQRVVANLRAPVRAADATLQVGASAGLAFYPHDAETEADLFRVADAALYRAKAQRARPDEPRKVFAGERRANRG